MKNLCLNVFYSSLFVKYNPLLCAQINNPDMRVVILKEYAQKNFPSTPILDYAIEVEKITTSKVWTFFRDKTVHLNTICNWIRDLIFALLFVWGQIKEIF